MIQNGYRSMAVMSLNQYAELTETIDSKLDEADKVAETSDNRYSHDEVFRRAKARIDAGR